MLNGIADFGKELDYGKKREQDFIKYMNGIVLRSSDGVIEDFMLFNGEKIELKSERYIHCDYNDFPNYKSKNFCIEIYSDKLSKKLGGPLRAEKDNIKYFCQFMGDDTLWVFETKNICKFIYDNILMGTDVITEIGNLKNIKNKNWTTLTWVFDRNLIKPIAKHIIKLEEGKNYKYLFDNTKEKTKEYNNFLILDTETTGLKKYYHEPVQIYGMFERKQKIQDKFNFYCQPRYIPTSEGWLYLATVIDLYSRRIVGWSMDETMKVSLVNDALKMALISRNPDKGLIWHTDRGSQYASYEHKDLLKRHGIIQSMSRKGNCHDNAVAESFFHTLKTELIHHEIYHTKEQAKRSIFEYIEVFYNRERSHSANNNLSPVEFEERQKLLQKEIAA
jgi:hypothetical protein